MKNAMHWLTRKTKKTFSMVAGRLAPDTRLARLKRDVANLVRIDPLFTATSLGEYLASVEQRQKVISALAQNATTILEQHRGANSFEIDRFCLCCHETMPMLVDTQSGGSVAPDGTLKPNWRERLVCRQCSLNNRQRLIAKLIQQAGSNHARPVLYLMEQVTPIFNWARQLDTMEVHGSEYLGFQYSGGTVVNGVRHEDVMDLSFPDASFDLIVSNDVMEHIPDPARALRECCRVLKPGGTVLATFPFHVHLTTTVVRARAAGTDVEFLMPPQYHGNPVSPEGSLVFHDFGWDVFESARAAGFDSAQCEAYGSDVFGHLGTGLLVFRMGKSARAGVTSHAC